MCCAEVREVEKEWVCKEEEIKGRMDSDGI